MLDIKSEMLCRQGLCAKHCAYCLHGQYQSPAACLTLLTTYCALLLGAPAAPACLVIAWLACLKADAMKLLWQLYGGFCATARSFRDRGCSQETAWLATC